MDHSPAQVSCYCAMDYLPPIKGLLTDFKHRNNLAAGRLLSACLAHGLDHAIEAGRVYVPQLLIPVPLHRQRLRQRGFNQAQFIATQVMNRLQSNKHQMNLCTDLCHRTGNRTPQQKQTRAQRLSEIGNDFVINKRGIDRAIDREIEHVAIIDDVMTTGATTQALCNSLIEAWPTLLNIQVWCVARAQAPNIQLEW